MIIVDKNIHHITNLNLLIITSVNSIVMIEKHNKLLIEMIMMRKYWKTVVLFIV